MLFVISRYLRLTHAEAAFMDPQSRILLEQTHLAIADATLRVGSPVPSDTGVYVGVMHMEFLQYLSSMGVAITPHVTTGNGMDFLIGRVSYMFGLTGPCLRSVQQLPPACAPCTLIEIIQPLCAVPTPHVPRPWWQLIWHTRVCSMAKPRPLLHVVYLWCCFLGL